MKLDKTWAIVAIAFVAIAGAAAAKWSDLPATGNVIDRRSEPNPRVVWNYTLPASMIQPGVVDHYFRGVLKVEDLLYEVYRKASPKGAGNLPDERLQYAP